MRYKVKVIVKAEVEYEVEVEAGSLSDAEDAAAGRWIEETPSDFQVNKGYLTDLEAEDVEQLSWECQECGEEISHKQYDSHDEMCAACYAVEVLRTMPAGVKQ